MCNVLADFNNKNFWIIKKIIIFAKAVVFSALVMFLSGCDRQAAPEVSFDNDGFNQALNDVYSNFGTFTRSSGPEDGEAYIEDVEMLMEWLQDIADEYNVKEIVENSAYYKELDMLDLSKLDELSIEEYWEIINANGTPECVRLFSQLSSFDPQFDMGSIVANDDLLPNEKIAFTFSILLINDLQIDISTNATPGPCEYQYLYDINICDAIFNGEMMLLGGSIIVSPYTSLLAVYEMVQATRAHAACREKAAGAYLDCINN